MAWPPTLRRLAFAGAYWANRARFAAKRRLIGKRLELGQGCDVWSSCLSLLGDGRAVFGRGCIVERGPFPLILDLAAGAEVRLGERTWVRGKYRPNILTCYQGAKIKVGPDSFLNGAVITARQSVTIGAGAMISWDVTIIDSDQHALDNDTPLSAAPVSIGDHVLLGAGVVVLPGARVGSHSVVGAGAVVKGEFPDHAVLAGVPARAIGKVGDRDRAQ